jgi:propanol-preferring alcohol dehydrogenase
MRALRYDGTTLELVESPAPVPARGGVVVDVLAAGLCHSDLTVMGRRPEENPFELPLVLGHEIAGVVCAVGVDVDGVCEGDAVVVYGPWGCGTCRVCRRGAENFCPNARRAGILPPGLGSPGGLADQVHVPSSRHVVPIGGLDPVQVAPLTDAGLTSFHAIRRALPALPAGGTAVVVGVGGLGHLTVQLLQLMAECAVVAVDTSADARALAARVGADVVLDPSTGPVEEQVRELTRGGQADVVIDLVATARTLASSAAMLRPGGELVIIGVGTDVLPVAVGRLPLGCSVRTPYWGTLHDLHDVVALARSGHLATTVETFTLDDSVIAYDRLRRGQVTGRAVVVPREVPA